MDVMTKNLLTVKYMDIYAPGAPDFTAVTTA